jgi:hypothetical protein
MTVALLFAVYLNYIMPENVFLVIASLATFATVWAARSPARPFRAAYGQRRIRRC